MSVWISDEKRAPLKTPAWEDNAPRAPAFLKKMKTKTQNSQKT